MLSVLQALVLRLAQEMSALSQLPGWEMMAFVQGNTAEVGIHLIACLPHSFFLDYEKHREAGRHGFSLETQ